MNYLQYIIPQHWLSRLMYRLTRVQNPAFKNAFIRWFVKTYQVDLSQAQRQTPEQYQSFNDFFTRALNENIRSLDDSAMICPVDGQISQLGSIKKQEILQAKGRHYSVKALLADEKKASAFDSGAFATIYLSPKDYHRIHMPWDGRLLTMDYIPGDLFSVNDKTTQSVDNLFARNERVVCYFQTDFGICALILVGAIFVGSIETIWEGQITPPYGKKITHFDYTKQQIDIKQGSEMGRFNMGSTVILLMPNEIDWKMDSAQLVKMGQALI